MGEETVWRVRESDMATERCRADQNGGDGYREQLWGPLRLCALRVMDGQKSGLSGNAAGRYFSIGFPIPTLLLPEEEAVLEDALCDAIRYFLPSEARRVLVAGLGNRRLTADALGALAADGVEPSAALPDALRKAVFGDAPHTFVITPDVFAQTGIESVALIGAAAKLVRADALLVFDALAARDAERLLCTVELTDSGTVPGGGVKNARGVLSEKTLGVPVLSVGVPTVVREDGEFLLMRAASEEGIRHLATLLSRAATRALTGDASDAPIPIAPMFQEEKR